MLWFLLPLALSNDLSSCSFGFNSSENENPYKPLTLTTFGPSRGGLVLQVQLTGGTLPDGGEFQSICGISDATDPISGTSYNTASPGPDGGEYALIAALTYTAIPQLDGVCHVWSPGGFAPMHVGRVANTAGSAPVTGFPFVLAGLATVAENNQAVFASCDGTLPTSGAVGTATPEEPFTLLAFPNLGAANLPTMARCSNAPQAVAVFPVGGTARIAALIMGQDTVSCSQGGNSLSTSFPVTGDQVYVFMFDAAANPTEIHIVMEPSDGASVIIQDMVGFDDGSFAVLGFLSSGTIAFSPPSDVSSEDIVIEASLEPVLFLAHFMSNGFQVKYVIQISSVAAMGQEASLCADPTTEQMVISFMCQESCIAGTRYADGNAVTLEGVATAARGTYVYVRAGEVEWGAMVQGPAVSSEMLPHCSPIDEGKAWLLANVVGGAATLEVFTPEGEPTNDGFSSSGLGFGAAIIGNSGVIAHISSFQMGSSSLEVVGCTSDGAEDVVGMLLHSTALDPKPALSGQPGPLFGLRTGSDSSMVASIGHTVLVNYSSLLDIVQAETVAPVDVETARTPLDSGDPAGTSSNTELACELTTDCPIGHRCSATECIKCAPGSYAPEANRDEACTLCNTTTYQPLAGQASCNWTCPDGMSTVLEGASSKDDCACGSGTYDIAWEFPSENTSACLDCPEGAICMSGVPTVAEAEYWKYTIDAPEDYEYNVSKIVVFEPCIPLSACTGENECAEGYDPETSCAACVRNLEDDDSPQYYRMNGNCFKCSTQFGVIFIVSVGAIVLLTFLYLFLRYKWILGAASIKLGISFVQLTALLGNIKNMWPQGVMNALGILSAVNFNIEALGPECFDTAAAEQGYFRVWGAKMVMPLVIISVLLALAGAFNKMGLKTVGNVMFRMMMQLLNIMYLYLATTSLQFFDCTALQTGISVLDASPITQCHDGDWYSWLPMAIFGLIVWVAGIPVAFGILLFNLKRHALLRDHKTLLENEYLIGHFKTRAFWWVLVDLVTKIMLLMVQLFFSSLLLLQLVFSVMIMLAVIVAHVWYKPYIWTVNNRLSILLFFNLIILLLFGVIFSVDADSSLNDTVNTVLTVIIVLIIAFSLGAIVVAVLKETQIRRRNQGHTWSEEDFLREDRKLGLHSVGEGGGTGVGIKDEPWYFSFDREEAETYLLDHPKVRFLVRPSSRFGCYTLSYLEDNKFKHSIIERTENNKFRLPPQTKEYDSVQELLQDQPSLMENTQVGGGDHYDDVSELKNLPKAQLATTAASSPSVTLTELEVGAGVSRASTSQPRASARASTTKAAAGGGATSSKAKSTFEMAEEQLATLAYWRPGMSRKEAEEELEGVMGANDVGVVRPSRKANCFAVSYCAEGEIHHTVVECRRLGLCIVDNEGDEQIFKSFDEALSFLHVEGKAD